MMYISRLGILLLALSWVGYAQSTNSYPPTPNQGEAGMHCKKCQKHRELELVSTWGSGANPYPHEYNRWKDDNYCYPDGGTKADGCHQWVRNAYFKCNACGKINTGKTPDESEGCSKRPGGHLWRYATSS